MRKLQESQQEGTHAWPGPRSPLGIKSLANQSRSAAGRLRVLVSTRRVFNAKSGTRRTFLLKIGAVLKTNPKGHSRSARLRKVERHMHILGICLDTKTYLIDLTF